MGDNYVPQNYEKDSVFLAYYFGNSQYLKDTAVKEGNKFQFKGEEPLKAGVYMIVLPPDNQFFQILINETEQTLSAKADFSDINQTIQSSLLFPEVKSKHTGYISFKRCMALHAT